MSHSQHQSTYRRISDGRSITLARQIGAGGEAKIFALHSEPDLCAKIYHQLPSAAMQDKLKAMLSCGVAHSHIAWPVDLIIDSAQHICGFLMPRLKGDLCQLYHVHQPNIRQQHVNFARFHHFQIAANIARAINHLHQHHIVVGDLNDANVLVDANTGIVALVDTDSFQLSLQGRHFLCDVARPEYLATELQNQDLSQTLRTPHHDTFCFAVMTFYLLTGFHPFVGSQPGMPMNLAERIAQELYCYNPRCCVPHSVNHKTDQWMSPGLRTLFKQTFNASQHQWQRPPLNLWIQVLESCYQQLVQVTQAQQAPSGQPTRAAKKSQNKTNNNPFAGKPSTQSSGGTTRKSNGQGTGKTRKRLSKGLIFGGLVAVTMVGGPFVVERYPGDVEQMIKQSYTALQTLQNNLVEQAVLQPKSEQREQYQTDKQPPVSKGGTGSNLYQKLFNEDLDKTRQQSELTRHSTTYSKTNHPNRNHTKIHQSEDQQ